MAATGAVALTVININEQSKRADKVEAAQKSATAVERAQQANQARRSRREQVREALVKQGENENTAATAGQTDSSAAVAAGDSIEARLGTNLGTINQALQFSSAKTSAQQDIFEANRKSTAEIVSGAAINIVGMSGK